MHNFISYFEAMFRTNNLDAIFFQAVTMRGIVCSSVTFLLPTNRLETINPFIKIH